MWQSSGSNLFQGPPPKPVTFCFGLWPCFIYQHRHSHWVWVGLWYYEAFHDNSVSQWLHLIKCQLQNPACPNPQLPYVMFPLSGTSKVPNVCDLLFYTNYHLCGLCFMFLFCFVGFVGGLLLPILRFFLLFLSLFENLIWTQHKKTPTELSSFSYIFFMSVCWWKWFFH